MPKALTRLALALAAASLCAVGAAAQAPPAQSPTDGAEPWLIVAPEGEGFGVLMSKPPTPSKQSVRVPDGLSVSGRRYAAADGKATFIVWALRDPQEVGARLLAADNSAEGVGGDSLYLDRMAEVAWELLLTPELERLKGEKDAVQRELKADVGMTFGRQFELSKHPAREYSVRLERERGLVYVCAEGARIYVVAGLSADAAEPRLKVFADSFTLGGTPRLPPAVNPTPSVPSTIEVDPSLVKSAPRDIPFGMPRSSPTEPSSGPGAGGGIGTATGIGPGRGGNTGGGGDRAEGAGGPGGGGGDYARPFKQSEVTARARITYKPEPDFTEWARRFNVTGVVRLRAILHSSGAVQNISVVKSLPHGLTRQALDALKQVRFIPAQKDGHAVSQYAVFEYNFNIY